MLLNLNPFNDYHFTYVKILNSVYEFELQTPILNSGLEKKPTTRFSKTNPESKETVKVLGKKSISYNNCT